jgi:hypothetical protein
MTRRASFPPSVAWLETRYAYDARARSKEIERIVLQDLASRRFLRIVDLGAGLGSNLRYYAGVFDCDQEWFCIERDGLLCREFAARLKKWAATLAWSCRPTARGVILRKDGTTVSAHLLPSSFLPFPAALAEYDLDLAMGNAVFDLLSRRQFLHLARALADRSVPLLATLNYASMKFAPARAGDRKIVESYERHMTLPRAEGAPMGPGCVPAMERILASEGYEVLKSESPWTISRRDHPLFRLLLQYVERSVGSIRNGVVGTADLRAWAARKKAEVRSGEVRLCVRHLDLYARLPQAPASRP